MTAYDDLAVYDIPFTDLETRVLAWVTEALELRHGAANDPDGTLEGILNVDSPSEVLLATRRVMMRVDRVDGLMARVIQAKARATRTQQQAKFAAEQAYDEATRNNAARRTIEFVTREERKADAALDSLEQRRLAHHAERLVSVTTEAYDVVKLIHWQLDGIRKDLRSTLHALQFESSLER